MPFPHTLRNSSPDARLRHFRDSADSAGDESIEEAIFEAGEERWGETVPGEEKVGCTFTYFVSITLF